MVKSLLQKLVCQFNSSLVTAHISGRKSVALGNETQLQMAVANVGPVSVAVDASSRTFRVWQCTHCMSTYMC